MYVYMYYICMYVCMYVCMRILTLCPRYSLCISIALATENWNSRAISDRKNLTILRDKNPRKTFCTNTTSWFFLAATRRDNSKMFRSTAIRAGCREKSNRIMCVCMYVCKYECMYVCMYVYFNEWRSDRVLVMYV